jgi:DNA (cytosine-5)-methyltransferase 1
MRYRDIDPRYQRYDTRSFYDRYLMLNPDEPCNTITAHMAKDGYRYIHWDTMQHRTLSVREAARTQSFGDHFRFAGHRTNRYIQIGNAVPPLLAEAIGRQVKRAITQRRPLESAGIWQLGLPGEEQRTTLVSAEAE